MHPCNTAGRPPGWKRRRKPEHSYSRAAVSHRMRRSPSAAASLQAHKSCKLSNMAHRPQMIQDVASTAANIRTAVLCMPSCPQGHAHPAADVKHALMLTRWCGRWPLLPRDQQSHFSVMESTPRRHHARAVLPFRTAGSSVHSRHRALAGSRCTLSPASHAGSVACCVLWEGFESQGDMRRQHAPHTQHSHAP